MPQHVTPRIFAVELRDAVISQLIVDSVHIDRANRMIDLSVMRRNKQSTTFDSMHDVFISNIINHFIDPVRVYGRDQVLSPIANSVLFVEAIFC